MRVVYCLMTLVLLTSLFMGCAAPAPAPAPVPAPTPAPKPTLTPTPTPTAIVLKGGSMHTAGDPSRWALDEFVKRVNEQAKGKLTIKMVVDPAAIKATDQMAALSRGLYDIGMLPGGYATKYAPELFAMVISEVDPGEARETGYYDLLDKIWKEKINIHFMGSMMWPQKFSLHTRIPVTKLEDFQGLKIRGSSTHIPLIKEIGAAPVVMGGGDIYTALERGVIDGFGWSWIGIMKSGWYEVAKYVIDPPFGNGNQALLVNLDTWNRLPEDMQGLLTDIQIQLEHDMIPHFTNIYEEIMKEAATYGVQQIQLSPEDSKLYLEAWDRGAWKNMDEKASGWDIRLKTLSRKEAVKK